MELAKYKACICEGAAEEAIIDILLDNHLLIFERSELIQKRKKHQSFTILPIYKEMPTVSWDLQHSRLWIIHRVYMRKN